MRVFKLLLAFPLLVAFAGCAAEPADVDVAAAGVCCGANCCLIPQGSTNPDDCYMAGDENPENSNEICDPSNPYSWTERSTADGGTGGTGGDAGTGGTGGTGGVATSDDGCGSSVTGSSSLAGVSLLLVGFVAFARRRRR